MHHVTLSWCEPAVPVCDKFTLKWRVIQTGIAFEKHLLTAVIQASLWLETPLALVKLQGCGLGMHPFANMIYVAFFFEILMALCYSILLLFLSKGVDCGTLSDPANGWVSHPSGTTFGQIAIYSCDPGYSLIGESTRICQVNATWSGIATTCQRKL